MPAEVYLKDGSTKTMNNIKMILDKKKELINEALYFLDMIEDEDYSSESDLENLQRDLDSILKEIGIEIEYEE
tara:strand:- start:302 stop:520 length:219 start_codon:yes stop_codon:yes gene_type:complete